MNPIADADTPDILIADVTIVGFGPVGKLLAIQLGRKGHRVVVVDRKQSGYPLPRAVTHCSDFARILQSIGLAPDIIPEVTLPYDDMYVWRNGEGRTLVEVDWSGHGESGWYNTYFFNQPALEDRLDALVTALPSVTVLRGWEAGELSQDEAATRTALRRTDDGRQCTVISDWLIGADGASSAIRQWAGIQWHDEGFFYDWLVVDVKPGPELNFPHVANQVCDTARPATMVPGGPGRRRWEFMRLPHESLQGEAHRLAAQFAAGPSFAHAMTKTMLHQTFAMPLEAAIEHEAQAQAACMRTRDFRRAYEAFAQKREPRFEGD